MNDLWDALEINTQWNYWVESLAPLMILGASFLVATGLVWAIVSWLRSGFGNEPLPGRSHGCDINFDRAWTHKEEFFAREHYRERARELRNNRRMQERSDSEWEADPDGDDSD